MDDDGNDRNDPRAFAAGSIPVEIYKGSCLDYVCNVISSIEPPFPVSLLHLHFMTN